VSARVPAPVQDARARDGGHAMTRDDILYYSRRAEAELDRAQHATHPAAARAHYVIANHYLDRVYGQAERRDVQAA
jgi:hypothetical protein